MGTTRMLLTWSELQARSKRVKALVFDWDGVFNGGWKSAEGGSPFSEVGSMGVNMLRFALWLEHGSTPPTAVITGRINPYAERFVEREHFHGLYMGYTDKRGAFQDFLKAHDLKPEEVAFFFDDALDITVARQCGLRVLIGRKAGRLFTDHVVGMGCADLVTVSSGAENGLREGTEAVIDIMGRFTEVFNLRAGFSDTYKAYLEARNTVKPEVTRQQRQSLFRR